VWRLSKEETILKKKLAKKELADYKKLLLKKKIEIEDSIEHASEETIKKSQKDASGDISGYAFHMADVATDTYDREFSLGIVSNERKALYELNNALKRIEDCSFGICEDCKNPIVKTRLKAIPYARLCLKCQEKREKK
jgi:RNA polymerase-binding protein DksA